MRPALQLNFLPALNDAKKEPFTREPVNHGALPVAGEARPFQSDEGGSIIARWLYPGRETSVGVLSREQRARDGGTSSSSRRHEVDKCVNSLRAASKRHSYYLRGARGFTKAGNKSSLFPRALELNTNSLHGPLLSREHPINPPTITSRSNEKVRLR